MFLRLQAVIHNYGSRCCHRHTYKQFTCAHMSLFLKWLHHLAVLSIAVLSVLPQLQFWCNNSFVEEKDKEAAVIYIYGYTLLSVEEVYSVSVPFCVFVGPIKTFMALDFVVYMCTEKLKKKKWCCKEGHSPVQIFWTVLFCSLLLIRGSPWAVWGFCWR